MLCGRLKIQPHQHGPKCLKPAVLDHRSYSSCSLTLEARKESLLTIHTPRVLSPWTKKRVLPHSYSSCSVCRGGRQGSLLTIHTPCVLSLEGRTGSLLTIHTPRVLCLGKEEKNLCSPFTLLFFRVSGMIEFREKTPTFDFAQCWRIFLETMALVLTCTVSSQ